MFKQSAERFATMVQSMKQMAAEMQQELEATRNELRRGVLEMPQEAAENTAQMRKVIVDQIEALAELNRIVARHGRGLDVVEHRPRQHPARGRADAGDRRRTQPKSTRRARAHAARRAAAPRTCRRRTSACRPRAAPKPRRSSPASSEGPRRMAFRPVEPRRWRHRRQRARRAAVRRSRPPAAIRWSRCRSTSAA